MELSSPLIHALESALLACIAVYYTLHIPAMLHHAHHAIHKRLKIKPGEKCGWTAAIAVITFMAIMGCVACAPAVHAAIGAVTIAFGQS